MMEVPVKTKIPIQLFTLLTTVSFILSGCASSKSLPVHTVHSESGQPQAGAYYPAQPSNNVHVSMKERPVEALPPSHNLTPGDFKGEGQVVLDESSADSASQNRASSGDEFNDGRFERPFDQKMGYLGNLDIFRSTLVRTDPDFIDVSIQVVRPVSAAINNQAYYGLELDLNCDGRSLFMIRGLGPLSETWSTEGVDVWKSTSAEQPAVVAEEGVIPVTGSLGFDVNLMKAGRGADTDLAWIRLKPGSDDTVEIAFKNSIVGGAKGKFIWRPFTDGAVFSENQYDLQVNYTLEQAGSPYRGEPDYPLKDVFAVDNTCRATSGYLAIGNVPGICPLSILEAPSEQ
jgi:hypothetical protein